MCKNRVLTLPIAAMIAGILTVVAGNHSLASSEPTAAAAVCIDEGADGNLDEFAKCWVVNMMSDDQRRVAHCIVVNKGLGGAAFCMSGMQLSPFGLQIAKCAQRHSGDARAITGCVGLPVLPPEGQRLAACVAVNPQIFDGARSAFHNPGRLAAGPNSAVDNPGALAGGANAVARNPDQVPGSRPSLSPKTLAVRF
jgi:hypothetical protein